MLYAAYMSISAVSTENSIISLSGLKMPLYVSVYELVFLNL
jgi:hypothetical protein